MPATTTNGPINLIRESSIESQGTIFDQMEQKTRKLLATRKKYEIDPALSLVHKKKLGFQSCKVECARIGKWR